MPFPKPPLSSKELPDLVHSQGTLPLGAMQPFLGRQLSVDELTNSETLCDEPLQLLHRVRAFPVLPLVGVLFQISDESQFSSTLFGLLRERLPGIEWEQKEISLAALHKYLIWHTSIAAPPDPATGQPMAIELYGDLIRFNDIILNSPDGMQWRDAWREKYLCCQDESQLVLAGNLELNINVATYSNLLYPGVGVPFYM